MLNSILRIDLLIIVFGVCYEILFLYYLERLRKELKKIEEEEMQKMLKKKYEKGDR